LLSKKYEEVLIYTL